MNIKINTLIILILVIFSVFMYAGKFPKLQVGMDGKMYETKSKLTEKEYIEFESKFEEVTTSLENIYEVMWNEFDSRGKGVLPWCIFQVFDDLKKRKLIRINFSILGRKKIPSGGRALSETKVGSFSKEKGIFIYGVYKDYFTYGWSQKSVCLKATLFHEILHFATFYNKESYFNIRKIRNQRGTNNENFWADEGIIEDCELKLFTCGLEYYYKLRYSWYPNNARKYSDPVDDCVLCKLCKGESQ